MRRFVYWFKLAAILLLFSSCRNMYIPNMQNVPLSREKGEAKLMINPQNFQGSYTFHENYGIILNGFYRQTSWDADLDLYTGADLFNSRMYSFEAGAGYFKPFGEGGVFEAYGGLGYGSVSHDLDFEDNEGYDFSADVIEYFIQPSIGYADENIEFAFTSRLTGVNFTGVTTTYEEDLLWNQDLEGIDQPTFLFWEPGITFRAGIEAVKLHSQILYSQKLNDQILNYKPFVINFGVHVNITKAIELLSK